MRSILVLLILVMIGLNGKGQSVTALPDSVLSQCCLEVTLLNGNVTTVDWVFIQYITRDGSGTKLFVEYAPNFGGIQWETQIRIQDDFDDVLERSKFIILPFTVGSTDYGIHRNWIANIEENTTTGGTWIYGRFGTPTKRKFSAVEDYGYLKNLLLACHPRAIVVAENGLYTEGDTVRMGGFLIENTTITTEGYNWMMKDTFSKTEFGIDYLTAFTGDTTVYWARRSGSIRQMMQMGNRYYYNSMRDTIGGLYSDFTHSWASGDPLLKYIVFNPLDPNSGTAWFQIQKNNGFWVMSNETTNPYYTASFSINDSNIQIGMNESGSGDPGNGVGMGAYGFGTTEYLYMITKGVDDNTATTGQFLQLTDESSGEVDFATIDLSAYLPIADTAAMLLNYPSTAGYGIIDAGKTWRADTTSPNGLATRLFAKTSPTSIIADRLVRSNGSNLVAGNLSDNATRLQALLPWQFQSVTTAGLPTGVTGYHVYNTTINGPGWYNGTRWAYGLESTFARGTATRVPFFDANGQVTDNSGLTFQNPGTLVGTAFSSLRLTTSATATANNQFITGTIFTTTNTPGAFTGIRNHVAAFLTDDATGSTIAIGRPYSNNFFATITSDFSTRNFIFDSGNSGGNLIFRKAGAQVLSVGSPRLAYAGSFLSSATESLYGLNTSFASEVGTSSYFLLREGNITGYKAAFGHDGNGSATIYAQRANTNFVSTDMKLRLSGQTGYAEFLNNTAGVLLGGGTTAQTPTEANGLIRYNSDSTLYQIYQGGARAYIATRAYARSLVSALPTTNIYTANGTLTGNRTITSGGFDLRYTGNFRVGSSSAPARTLDVTGEARISDLTTDPPTRIVGADADGDLGELGIAGGLSISGGVLTGLNGIYSGSGTLASSITRPLISPNNKLLFTQKYNAGADSAYLHFYNLHPTAGNRSITLGITDTVHAGGFAEMRLEKDETNDKMQVEIETLDQDGTSKIGSYGNAITFSATDFIQSSANEIRLNDGEVKMNLYGTGTMDAVTLGKTQSGYLSGFATDGTVLDYPISSFTNGIYSGSDSLSQADTYAKLDIDGMQDFGLGYFESWPTIGGTNDYGLVISQNNSELLGFINQKSRINAGTGSVNISAGYPGTEASSALQLNQAELTISAKGTGGIYLDRIQFGVDSISTFLNASVGTARKVRFPRATENDVSTLPSTTNDKMQTMVWTGDGTDANVTWENVGLTERYHTITSTSSPQTFSSIISDNIVDQGSTQASFTFNFPASPFDGQVLTMTWNNAISVITLNGNGNTIVGTAVTTAVAGTQRKFKYCGTCTTPAWIKIY